MLLKSNLTPASPVKVMLNVGSLMDVPTGYYVKGIHGENLLLGGLGQLTGVTGIGNSFKSTIMHYMMLSAAEKMYSTSNVTNMSTYDTEINVHEERLKSLTTRFPGFANIDILDEGIWTVTDKTKYYGNEWYEKLKEFLAAKEKDSKNLTFETPFMDRGGKSLLSILIPTFCEVDSFSDFETSDIGKMQDENELGSSGANTIHMRQGLAKLRFLMEIPALGGSANHYTMLTAHLGKDLAVASGPHQAPPPKKLQNMKQGDKIKGVTDKFFFLTNNFWQTTAVSHLVNQGTKGPEYPRNSDENDPGDRDLQIVSLMLLRSKSGPSGNIVQLIVSQIEGILPSLTEFHYLKENDRFGLSGTLQSYSLDIYPDVKLGRTTVRGKIDADEKLRRALNITAELSQMHEFYRSLKEILVTPAEMYEKIKANGYDWDMILTQTRGWWTVLNDTHPLMYLSTLDLVNMCHGTYHPYWMEDDKKSIKKQYKKS